MIGDLDYSVNGIKKKMACLEWSSSAQSFYIAFVQISNLKALLSILLEKLSRVRAQGCENAFWTIWIPRKDGQKNRPSLPFSIGSPGRISSWDNATGGGATASSLHRLDGFHNGAHPLSVRVPVCEVRGRSTSFIIFGWEFYRVPEKRVLGCLILLPQPVAARTRNSETLDNPFWVSLHMASLNLNIFYATYMQTWDLACVSVSKLDHECEIWCNCEKRNTSDWECLMSHRDLLFSHSSGRGWVQPRWRRRKGRYGGLRASRGRGYKCRRSAGGEGAKVGTLACTQAGRTVLSLNDDAMRWYESETNGKVKMWPPALCKCEADLVIIVESLLLNLLSVTISRKYTTKRGSVYECWCHSYWATSWRVSCVGMNDVQETCQVTSQMNWSGLSASVYRVCLKAPKSRVVRSNCEHWKPIWQQEDISQIILCGHTGQHVANCGFA